MEVKIWMKNQYYFGANNQGYTSIDGHKFKLDELLFSSVLESFSDTSIDTSLYEEELGLLLK